MLIGSFSHAEAATVTVTIGWPVHPGHDTNIMRPRIIS